MTIRNSQNRLYEDTNPYTIILKKKRNKIDVIRPGKTGNNNRSHFQ